MGPTKARLTAEKSSYAETSLFVEIEAREEQGTSRKLLLCCKMPLSEESGTDLGKGRKELLQILLKTGPEISSKRVEIGCYRVISLF